MGAFPPLASLTLRQLIGQLIVVRGSGFLFDGDRHYPQWEADQQTLQTWIQEDYVGGVILLGGSAAEVSLKTQQLQSWAEIPLLIAADIEEGVGQRFAGATWFPPPMALAEIYTQNPDQAIALAEEMGRVTAREALSLGINWILAPVLDVNNNPANPVINVRAFGENPEVVAILGKAFIRGAQDYPALTTAKHFPGHGDTAQDSHLSLPTIPHDFSRLDNIELRPFREAIAAGVDAVMTAHLMIPALDHKYPATLSPAILSELLRKDLGFSGLIVTDALMMAGVTQFADPAEVAVLALEAGADILLMPPDVPRAIAAVESAVKSGRLSRSRLEASVQRLWQAKQKLNSPESPQSPIPSFPQGVRSPQAEKTVCEILDNAAQHHHQKPLPSFANTDQPAQNLIVVDALMKSDFLRPNCPAIALPQRYGYQPQIIECQHLETFQPKAIPTVMQFFLRGNPFTGNLIHPLAHLQNLAKILDLQAVLFYGSPYFLAAAEQAFPALPLHFSYGQMAIAQQQVLTPLWHAPEENPSSPREFT